MRKLRTFGLPIAACLSLALGICQAQTMRTHHVRQATQDGTARYLGNLSSAQTLRLTITLPLHNQDELDQLIQNLYDPSSPSYHKFLTVDQFTAEFGPTEQEYDSAINYFRENGLTVVDTTPNRVNLQVTGSVANVQRALHVNLGVYQHPTESRTFYAPDKEPTTGLSISLWHVDGLDNFSVPQPAGLTHIPQGASSKSGATTGSGPSASFLGSDMRAAYYGGTLTGSGQTVGLLEFYGTDLADLQTYYTNAKQTYPGSIVTLYSADGTSTSCVDSRAGGSCDDTEQTLDMTQALGVAPGLAHLVVFVGSSDSAIFGKMATYSPLPLQLSSSWTWSPADPSTDNPYFEEFAAQGQNLFQAAGDSGAWTTSGTASEIYPSDDPYVTSVGGTDLSTSKAAGSWSAEAAWADSGGGISPDKFAIPSWQVTAAGKCPSCSQSYRNGPDVSANANFTYYVCADQTACTANDYGGTSFAAPLWAGYLALVNQQRATNGNGPLGFINPSLYLIGDAGGTTYSTAFHDITSGSNGYSAATGYDLATGWGSPNGAGLLNDLAATTTTSGFTVSALPTTLSIAAGSSSSATIASTTTGSFKSAVSLSATGQPSGVTISFSPTSITGTGSSAMSIAAGSTVAAGTYTITVKGTYGGTTSSAVITLTVTAVSAGFSISASPSSRSLAQGQSGSAVVTTAITGGFKSAITLSATGQPSGVTIGFSPTSITGAGSSTMSIAAGSTVAAGTYTITVKGAYGSTTSTTTFALTVTAVSASFNISVSPSAGYLLQGQSGYAVVTTTITGSFKSGVTLSATGVPPGVTASFSPASIASPGSGSADFILTVARTAKTGTYPITITGTGGGVTKTTTLTFEILP